MSSSNASIFLRCYTLLAFLLLVLPASGQMSTSPIFGSNMVLQRNHPIRIWGKAPAGTQVNLRLHTQLSLAFADNDGNWEAVLGSLPAGGPYSLEITSPAGNVTHTNVMLGEVWLCAGQSNMQRPLKIATNGTAEAAAANWPNIRLLTAPEQLATTPMRTLPAMNWQICTPTNAGNFSGTAYFFGRDLYQNLNVPIGLITVAWGGTGIDTWISPSGLAAFPQMNQSLAQLPFINLETLENSINEAQATWDNRLETEDLGLQQNWQSNATNWSNWPSMLIPNHWEAEVLPNRDGSVWFKKTMTLTAAQAAQPIQLSLGRIDDSDQTWVNGHFVGQTDRNPGILRSYTVPAQYLVAGTNTVTVRVRDYGYVGGMLGGAENMKAERDFWTVSMSGYWHYQIGTPNLGERPLDLDPDDYPALIFNGMVAPFLGLRIAGVVWYQGESNTDSPFAYRDKQIKLIDDWRQQWGIGDFAFITTQLPFFRTTVSQPGHSSWATLRESQAHTLKRANTAMACLIDKGDPYDIHPGDKFTFGTRLARAARKLVYNHNIIARGPSFQEASIAGANITITFRTHGSSLQSSSPTNLAGFAIAGENGQFVWANAQLINGQTVRVSHPSVPNPRYVRYAWSDNPGSLNLFNAAGLPAEPFRTDHLPTPWQ